MEGVNSLEHRVKQWLNSSGAKEQLQARLRADMFIMLQKENSSLGISGSPPKVGLRDRAVNWLVSQHLVHNKCWLANSVFVTEADIGVEGEGQYSTEVAGTETVGTVLDALGVKKELHVRGRGESILSCLLGTNNLDNSCESNKKKVATIPENLENIEHKYEKILKDFTDRRKVMEMGSSGYQPQVNVVQNNVGGYISNPLKLRPKNDSSMRRKEPERKSYIDKQLHDDNTTSEHNDNNSHKTSGLKSKDSSVQLQDLYEKIEQFVSVHEKDHSIINDLETRLRESNEEVMDLKQKVEYCKLIEAKQLENDRIVQELKNLLSIQLERIESRNKELDKLRSHVETHRLIQESRPESDKKEKYEKKKILRANVVIEDNTSPTQEFLDKMRSRLINMRKEETCINDDFQDINFESSLKE